MKAMQIRGGLHPITFVTDGGQVATLEGLCDAFTDYIVMQCGYRGLSPRTTIMNVHYPAIVAMLTFNRQPNHHIILFKAAVTSEDVKLTLRGFERIYDRAHPMSGRVTLPFGLDMKNRSAAVMESQRRFERSGSVGLSECGALQRWRILVIMTVGIMVLLRKSEHIEDTRARAVPVDRSHIYFFTQAGRRIPYALVGTIRAESIVVKIPFSKADPTGIGRVVTHFRQNSTPDLCLVCCMEGWIAHTRDRYGAVEADLLYHVPGFVPIKASVVMSVMRATVASVGITGYTGRFCTHSLRYGGAVTLSDAGHPEYIIAIYGGWAQGSRVIRRYLAHLADHSIARVSADFARIGATDSSANFIRNMQVQIEV